MNMVYKYLLGTLLSVLLDVYPEMKLLCHVVHYFLFFEELLQCFP